MIYYIYKLYYYYYIYKNKFPAHLTPCNAREGDFTEDLHDGSEMMCSALYLLFIYFFTEFHILILV